MSKQETQLQIDEKEHNAVSVMPGILHAVARTIEPSPRLVLVLAHLHLWRGHFLRLLFCHPPDESVEQVQVLVGRLRAVVAQRLESLEFVLDCTKFLDAWDLVDRVALAREKRGPFCRMSELYEMALRQRVEVRHGLPEA